MSVERATLRVRKLRPDAQTPRYATEGAAGLDLTAALDDPIRIAPGGRASIPTGIAIALPPGHEGQVRPRSGLARKSGVSVLNAPGTIDEDYRGELQVLLINLSDQEYVVRSGDRVAQLVIAPVTRVDVTIQSALPPTSRGANGFGSTGR